MRYFEATVYENGQQTRVIVTAPNAELAQRQLAARVVINMRELAYTFSLSAKTFAATGWAR